MASSLKASKMFGSFFWASGPLFLGSAALEQAALSRDRALLKALLAATKARAVKVHALRGEQTVLFGPNTPSAWHQGKRGGVLVRIHEHANRADWEKLVATDPAHVPADGWTLGMHALTLKGDAKRRLIDPWAGDPNRAATGTPVTLAAGAWEIDHAQLGKPRFAVDLYRFRPKGEVVAASKPAGKLVGPPMALVLEPPVKKLGKKLKFVGTAGGPVLLLPVALLTRWNGVCDEAGQFVYGKSPCDYDRACAARKYVLGVGGGQALVLGLEATALFIRDPKTAFLLSWIGADDASHVLQAALSAGEKQFKPTKEVFTLESKQGVALFDSAERGADLKKPFVGALPPGRWAIDEMREFDGSIVDGASTHGLMTTALRLRRL